MGPLEGDKSMSEVHVHVAAATLNQTVGDWVGNLERIALAIEEARIRGASVLVLPEMCIPGYSLGDRLLRDGTLRRSWEVMRKVAELATDLVVLVGLPVRHTGVVYNAMAVVSNGRVHGMVAKENLATGDVEYESRWYQAWPGGHTATICGPDGLEVPIGNLVFDLGGQLTLGIEVCEDAWLGFRPGSRYAVAGADIVANPSASWFMVGKHAVRRRMVEQISLEDHCLYVYTSLLGCDATRLIFDGSLFIAADGQVVEEGRRFVFDADVELVDAVHDLTDIRMKRMESGSWRQQVMDTMVGEHGAMPQRIFVLGGFASAVAAAPAAPYWIPAPRRSLDPSLEHLRTAGLIGPELTGESLSHLELELGLCMGMRDYLKKTGAGGYCLALSGGRDSAMVALLVYRMFRYDNPTLDDAALKALIAGQFTCAYMATENSTEATRSAARAIAEACGATFYDGDIDGALAATTQVGEKMLGIDLTWEDPAHDIALQNIQARARSVIIWLIANVRRQILLTTSNKSEASVGYATMDGDTSGGLSPISDVPKSLVQLWLAWARTFHAVDAVDHVLVVPASAELRPHEQSQTDEDDLMPFVVLDQLMYHFIQRGLEPLDIFKTLWPRFSPMYGGQPRLFAEHVRRFVRMLCQAQWKRERFAIGFRVTAFDLDPKTGWRFPPVQNGFDVELAELAAYVDALVASGA